MEHLEMQTYERRTKLLGVPNANSMFRLARIGFQCFGTQAIMNYFQSRFWPFKICTRRLMTKAHVRKALSDAHILKYTQLASFSREDDGRWPHHTLQIHSFASWHPGSSSKTWSFLHSHSLLASFSWLQTRGRWLQLSFFAETGHWSPQISTDDALVIWHRSLLVIWHRSQHCLQLAGLRCLLLATRMTRTGARG